MSDTKETIVKTRRPNGKMRVQVFNHEPSLAQQQFKDITDVNRIMEKYTKTREVIHLNNRQGQYADLTHASDYFESALKIKKAQAAFDQLPSDVRKRFNNEPGQLLAFIHDPKNFDEGVKLGIFNPKEKPITTIPDPIPDSISTPKKAKAKNDDD